MPDRRLRRNDMLGEILLITDKLNQIKDLDALLDQILYHARILNHAEAGSIFLKRHGRLLFSHVQNELLFSGDESVKYHFTQTEIDIDDTSMAGFVARSGQPLLIDDAYNLPEDAPYRHNQSLDENSGYETHSMMTVPLKTSRDKVVGVLQLINALDGLGRTTAFSERNLLFATHFGNSAAVAIERAIMTREIILRMIKMAELRDPKETGAHVNRVGAYAAETYRRWAENNSVESDEIKRVTDLLRLAAMLHDVGKVAISDSILKKPGRMTNDEYQIMKLHTIQGARLFTNSTSDLDQMSADIALTHHERWDGKGYPGPVMVGDVEELPPTAVGLSGEDIPLLGRITALADVYDALISVRTYKKAWPHERVMDYIVGERGGQFDPQVVDAFTSIEDTILAIRAKYQD